MSYREVMEMPIRAFWSFNKNMGRISAERDMRTLDLLASSQSGEALREKYAGLREELGQPITAIDNRRDKNAVGKLREALTG